MGESIHAVQKQDALTYYQILKMCMFALTVSIVESKNIKEAMADFAWIEAIQEELHQFDRLQVWELGDKPFGKNVIKLKWLWKNIWMKSQYLYIANKARLVARVPAQEEGVIDFERIICFQFARLEAMHDNCLVALILEKHFLEGVQFLGDKLVSRCQRRKNDTISECLRRPFLSSQAVNKSPTHYPCDSARTFRVILFSIHNDEWKSFQCHHQTALRIHKDGDGDASFQLKSNSLPHAHAQTTKTFYKHQDSRIMKAQELKTKTSAQTLIYKIFLQRYQVYQGRLLASFQDDAKYEHSTSVVKTIKGEVQLHALVDGKKIIISKASVRRDLKLKDEEGMIRNLDNVSGKFLMYPRFVPVFLDQQLDGLSTHKRIYNAPSHTKKIFGNMRRVGKGFSGRVTPLFPTMVVQNQAELDKGSAIPTDPHHTPTIIESSSQPQKTQKPRKPKRKDTQERIKRTKRSKISQKPTRNGKSQVKSEDGKTIRAGSVRYKK
ncbi:hypothetical protein Tco_0115960 [Tanacetum coccineum]